MFNPVWFASDTITVKPLRPPSAHSLFLTFLAPFVGGMSASGATKIWDGGAATLNWADGNNWNTDGLPANGDIVQFNSGAVTGGSTVAVNVATFASPSGALTLNNGAGFTLNFGAAGGNYNYFATVTVSDANSYAFTNIVTKSFGFVNGNQNFNIATGGRLTINGNFVVGSYGATIISKTGGGELDLSTGITNFESTSRIAGISASGGIVRAAVKPNTKWTMGSGVSASSGSQIFLTGNGSVASVGSTAVSVAGSLTLSGVVLQSDALNTNWSGSTAGTFNLIDNGGIDLRGQSISIDKITGTGKIYNSYAASGQKTLTVGTGNGSSSFDGVIYGDAGATGTQTFFTGYDGNSGSLGLAKTGTGTLTLTGANVYSGPTAIKNGTLILAGGNDRLGIAGTVVLGDTSTTGKLILGNATAAANQTLSGLSATGSGGSVVGAHANTASVLTINVASGTNTFAGTLGGGGPNENNLALTKTGVGTFSLSGINSYTGATIVDGGKLSVNGSAAGSAFTVNSGGTLAGTGAIGALSVTSGGVVGPGDSLGILSTGTLTLGSGSILEIQLNGTTPGSGYDQLNVTGSVSLAGTLSLISGFTPSEGNLFFILANDGSDTISGTFAGLADGSTLQLGGQDYLISYFADSTANSFIGGNDVALMAVPEPTVLSFSGLAVFILFRRRREFAR